MKEKEITLLTLMARIKTLQNGLGFLQAELDSIFDDIWLLNEEDKQEKQNGRNKTSA